MSDRVEKNCYEKLYLKDIVRGILEWVRNLTLEETDSLLIKKYLCYNKINNTAYIVMKYLEGITLKQHLKENQRIAPEALLDLFVPLVELLAEIHSQGLIFRDISPDNIMVLLHFLYD